MQRLIKITISDSTNEKVGEGLADIVEDKYGFQPWQAGRGLDFYYTEYAQKDENIEVEWFQLQADIHKFHKEVDFDYSDQPQDTGYRGASMETEYLLIDA